jgi:vancomycin resistance protein YoaR
MQHHEYSDRFSNRFDRFATAPAPSQTAPAQSLGRVHGIVAALPPAVFRLARGVAAGLALLLLIAAAGLLLAEQRYDGRVYPNVTAGEIALGGMTVEDAQASLAAESTAYGAQTITFTYGDKIWTPTYAELGIAIDVDRTLNEATGVGREQTARDRIGNVAGLLREDYTVPLAVTIDQATLNAWFDAVDADLGLTPHDAFLRIDGAEVSIEPEAEGTVIDRPRTTELVVQGAAGHLIPDGELPAVATVARIRAKDLEAAQANLATALSKPVELTRGKKTWTIEPEQVAQYIVQTVDPEKLGAEALTVTVDEQALATWFNELLKAEVDRDPVNAKVAWNYERQEVFAVEESRNGVRLKPNALAKEVVASFWGDHSSIEIPVTTVRPEVDSDRLDELGITTRLAVGDSAYVGSNDGRATNIEVGVSLLNGTLIPPGGEFSFNHAIGVIEESKGYVEAAVISGERIGRDVGGGICQVSTTVYRAALLAGLPITEWWPHTYRLSFYELDGWLPGYDASILQPDGDPFGGGDFKFVNPTDSWMLVESYTEDERAYVIIYGADTGYKVEFSEPQLSDPIPPPDSDIEVVDPELPEGSVEQSEHEQEGLEVIFDRTVTGKDGEVVLQDTWDTLFASRPDVWKVSPDMEGKSPARENSDQ